MHRLQNPLVILLWLALFYLAIFALHFNVMGWPATVRSEMMAGVSLVMLLCGLIFYRLAGAGGAQRYPTRGALLALAAAIIAVFAQAIVARQSFTVALDPTLVAGQLVRYVVIIGLAEELWFRGLWMHAAGERFVLAVIVGALLFGLFHLPLGSGRVVTLTALGFLYAAARWRGAPIWSLALAHGTVNTWLTTIAPATAWRFDPTVSQGIFAGVVIGAAIIMIVSTRPATPTRTP